MKALLLWYKWTLVVFESAIPSAYYPSISMLTPTELAILPSIYSPTYMFQAQSTTHYHKLRPVDAICGHNPTLSLVLHGQRWNDILNLSLRSLSGLYYNEEASVQIAGCWQEDLYFNLKPGCGREAFTNITQRSAASFSRLKMERIRNILQGISVWLQKCKCKKRMWLDVERKCTCNVMCLKLAFNLWGL